MELGDFFFKRYNHLSFLSFIWFLEFFTVFVPGLSEEKSTYQVLSEIVLYFKKFCKIFRPGSSIEVKFGQMNLKFLIFFVSKKFLNLWKTKTFKKKKKKNLKNYQNCLIFRKFIFSFLKNFFLNKSKKILFQIKMLGLLVCKKFFPRQNFFFIISFLSRNSNSKSAFIFFYLNVENYNLSNIRNRRSFYFFFSVLKCNKNRKNLSSLVDLLKKKNFFQPFSKRIPRKETKITPIKLGEQNFLFLNLKKNLFFQKAYFIFKKKKFRKKAKDPFWWWELEEKLHHYIITFENKKIFLKKIALIFNQFKKKIPAIKINFRGKFIKKTLIFCTQKLENWNFSKKRILELCKEDNRFSILLKKELEKFLKTKNFLPMYLINIIEFICALINDRILSHFFFLNFFYKLLIQKKNNMSFSIKKIKKFLKKKYLTESILHQLNFEKITKFFYKRCFFEDQKFFSENFSHSDEIRKKIKVDFYFSFLSKDKEYRI